MSKNWLPYSSHSAQMWKRFLRFKWTKSNCSFPLTTTTALTTSVQSNMQRSL